MNPLALAAALLAHPVAILPHPSGRCLAWNDPAAYRAARAALVEIGALPPDAERAT